MFWRKKSVPQRSEYISFYVEDDELKVEFGVDDINKLTYIADLILNGMVRNSCFQTIESKLREGGMCLEADYFAKRVNKTIKPSEYKP